MRSKDERVRQNTTLRAATVEAFGFLTACILTAFDNVRTPKRRGSWVQFAFAPKRVAIRAAILRELWRSITVHKDLILSWLVRKKWPQIKQMSWYWLFEQSLMLELELKLTGSRGHFRIGGEGFTHGTKTSPGLALGVPT